MNVYTVFLRQSNVNGSVFSPTFAICAERFDVIKWENETYIQFYVKNDCVAFVQDLFIESIMCHGEYVLKIAG